MIVHVVLDLDSGIYVARCNVGLAGDVDIQRINSRDGRLTSVDGVALAETACLEQTVRFETVEALIVDAARELASAREAA